jgi:hypothetical protein
MVDPQNSSIFRERDAAFVGYVLRYVSQSFFLSLSIEL